MHLIDCRLVRVLLEQVVSSTIERCVEPVIMEQSVSFCWCSSSTCSITLLFLSTQVVEVICERN